MYLAVGLIVLILALLVYLDVRKPKNFPPGPKWWPVVGSAIDIVRAKKRYEYLYLAIAGLAKKYGPVLGFKFGKDKLVIVYGVDEIKEFLMSNDLAGRPDDEFYTMRTFNKRRGIILVDEAFWQEQKRFLLRQLKEFGFGKKTMSGFVEEEAAHMVQYLKDSIRQNDSCVFAMENIFNVFILNTIWKMITGLRYHPDDERVKDLLKLLSALFATVDMMGGLFSHFPILKYIAPEKSGYNLMVDLHVKMYNVIREVLEQHKTTHKLGEPRDLIDVYLDAINSDECSNTFTEEQLLAVCLDIFMAGSETTNNTLSYGINFLILHPEVQQKAREEIDRVIGKGRCPTLDDRPNLPYMECVALETLRMFGGRVFIVPHRALKDTYLSGYFIPKGVLVIAPLHGPLLANNNEFKDPEVFNPERFLKNGKVTLPDSYMPFGIGKRRCMGETLAKANVFLFLCTLLQNFEFSVVPGDLPTMKMNDGVTPSLKHFKAKIIPRN